MQTLKVQISLFISQKISFFNIRTCEKEERTKSMNKINDKSDINQSNLMPMNKLFFWEAYRHIFTRMREHVLNTMELNLDQSMDEFIKFYTHEKDD